MREYGTGHHTYILKYKVFRRLSPPRSLPRVPRCTGSVVVVVESRSGDVCSVRFEWVTADLFSRIRHDAQKVNKCRENVMAELPCVTVSRCHGVVETNQTNSQKGNNRG